MTTGEWVKGFAKYRSDWSKTGRCDYTTNRIVHDFYWGKSKWYRTGRFPIHFLISPLKNRYHFPAELLKKVLNRDTVIVGLDYYSIHGVSYQSVPYYIRKKKNFSKGQVYKYKVYLKRGNEKIKIGKQPLVLLPVVYSSLIDLKDNEIIWEEL